MSAAYRRNPDVDETRVKDCWVLFHRGAGKAIVLNATGSWVWSLLPSHSSSDELAEQLRARFPSLSTEQATCDVERFLDEAAEHGILVRED